MEVKLDRRGAASARVLTGLLYLLGALVVLAASYGSVSLIWQGMQWMRTSDMKDMMLLIGLGRIVVGMVTICVGAGGLLLAGFICASLVRLAASLRQASS